MRRIRPVHFSVMRLRKPLKKAAVIAAFAVFIKIFSATGSAARLEDWVIASGVKSIAGSSQDLEHGLGLSAGGVEFWKWTIMNESSALRTTAAPAETLPEKDGEDFTNAVLASGRGLEASGDFRASDNPMLPEDNDDIFFGTEPAIDQVVRSGAQEPEEAPPGALPVLDVTINPASPKGYDYGSGVYIKNDTKFPIDVDGMLEKKLSIAFTGNNADVLIIHTHTSESYFPDEKDWYVPTDVERTEDTNFNVARVGDEIEKILKAKGLNVIHDRTVHDFPTYSGSYTRTLSNIEKIMKKSPSIKVIIDVHRDSLTREDGTMLRTITEINGKKAAQVMLVMGTSQGGLPHEKWQENLKLALRIQKKMNEKYPTLARPINLRKERFNQHVTTGSMIIEIGCSGNTLSEAEEAARLFADSAGDVLAALKK